MQGGMTNMFNTRRTAQNIVFPSLSHCEKKKKKKSNTV